MCRNLVFIIALNHDRYGGSNKHLNNFCDQSLISKKFKYIYISNDKVFYSKHKERVKVLYLPFLINPILTIIFKLLFSLILNLYLTKKINIIDFFNPIFLPSKNNQIAIIRDLGEFFVQQKYDFIRMFYRKHLMIPLSLFSSNRIIAISNKTKNDILLLFPRYKNKIQVIYHGADITGVRKQTKKSNFFLSIGRLDPVGKNLINMVHAFDQYKQEGGLNNLIIVGPEWRNTQLLIDYIDKLDSKKYIKVSGFLKSQEKLMLLTKAQGMLFLSNYEGFGHPLLEALDAGTNALVSSIDIFHEIGIKEFFYCDHKNIEDIKKGLFKLENFRYTKKFFMDAESHLSKYSWHKMFNHYEETFV